MTTFGRTVSEMSRGRKRKQRQGVPQDLTAAHYAVSSAVSQANGYVRTVNGYLRQAYSTASNLAGSASRGGPPHPATVGHFVAI